MPTYATPELPPEVAGTVHTLGINQARLAIIIALKRQPGPIPDLAQRTGLTAMTVNRHLLELEAEAVVTASRPQSDPGRRRAAGVVWTLDHDKINSQIQALINELR